MPENWVDFKQLKQSVSIAALLARYGVKLSQAGPGYLRGRCPLPSHSSDRSDRTFGVKLATNAWSCLSASCRRARGGNQSGGSALDFVCAMEQCSLRDAALKIQDWIGEQLVAEKECALRGARQREDNQPLGFVLRDLDPGHSYLAARGIDRETAERFGMGFYGGPGLMRCRIAIPIHDATGTLLAYAGRALGDQKPRYLLPAGFRKSQVLFNLNRALAAGGDEVILVEGFFGAIWLHQSGYLQTVALMGTTMSAAQTELLSRHFRRVLLLLDGDAAGCQASPWIAAALAHAGLDVRTVELPAGVQPDHLSSGDLRRLLAPM